MKKHTDKVACNKKCKSDYAKPVCAKGKAGKACRKDKSWKDKKATCLVINFLTSHKNGRLEEW